MRGPTPTHCPRFPADFLERAAQLVRRRTAPAQLRQRASLACLLHQHPDLSHEQAAARAGLAVASVRRWRRRWAAGTFALEDQSGRGRQADFSPPGSGDRQGHRL